MKPLFSFLSLVFLVIASPLFSQTTFSFSYGAPEMTLGKDLIQTTDGGFLMLGQIHLGPDNVIYVVKTNAAGSVQWADSIGNFPNGAAECIKQTSDLGYIICGQSNSGIGANGVDGFLLKLNSSGNIIWERSYGGLYSDQLSEVEQMSDGGYIAAGGCLYINGYTPYAYAIRTDANGDTLWTKAYNPGSSAEFSSLSKTMDGGFIFAGKSGMNGQDIFVLKTDSNGTQQWAKGFGGNNIDNAVCVRQTPDSGYVICGSTMSFGAGSSDMLFLKCDKNGNPVQARTYGDAGDEIFYDVETVAAGGFIFTGQMSWLGAAFLLRTDSVGDTLWLHYYNDASTNATHSSGVTCTFSGGFAFTGHYVDQNFSLFMTLIKTDTQGNIPCSEQQQGLIVSTPTLNSYSINTNIIHGGVVSNRNPVAYPYSTIHDFCLTTGVEEDAQQISQFYPNPFRDQTEFIANNDGELIVYDMYGRRILNREITSGRIQIEKGLLPAGIYTWVLMKDGQPSAKGKLEAQ